MTFKLKCISLFRVVVVAIFDLFARVEEVFGGSMGRDINKNYLPC